MATLTSTGRFAAGEACADNDIFYGPYATIAAAHAALLNAERNVVGRTVGIQTGNTIEEYWYQGGTTEQHLVKKQSSEVEANPTGEPTETLEKLKIGETIYTAPQGPQGEPGEDGQDGQPGAPGPANTLTIGAVADGEEADASITGNAPNQTLNLILPIGKSAYKIAVENGFVGDEEAWLASLKANIGAFKFVANVPAVESEFEDATTGGVGTIYAQSIDGISAGQNTLSVILLMNTISATPAKTYMIATQEVTPATTPVSYEFIYAGDLQSAMSSNVLTQTNIVNDCTTGGVDDVASAETVKMLNSDKLDKQEKQTTISYNELSPVVAEPAYPRSSTYLNKNGSESSTPTTTMMVSKYPVVGGNTYYVTGKTGASSSNALCCFYGNSDTKIGDAIGVPDGSAVTYNREPVIAPPNAAYIRIMGANVTIKCETKTETTTITKDNEAIIDSVGDVNDLETTTKSTVVGAINEVVDGIDTLQQDINDVDDRIDDIFITEISPNLFDKTQIIDGYYINTSGNISNNAISGWTVYKVSGLIPVEPNKYYQISGNNINGGYNIRCLASDGTTTMKVLAPENGNENSNYEMPNSDGTGRSSSVMNSQFKTPATAAYVQFNVGAKTVDASNTTMIELVGDTYNPSFIPSEYQPYGQTEKINNDFIEKDTEPVENGEKPITSGGVYEALQNITPSIQTKKLKLLLIGSSHGMNTIAQFPWIASKSGIDVEVGNVYLGSLSMQRIVGIIERGETVPYKHFSNGEWSNAVNKTFAQVFAFTDWDFISVQRSATDDELWITTQKNADAIHNAMTNINYDTELSAVYMPHNDALQYIINTIKNNVTNEACNIIFNTGFADPSERIAQNSGASTTQTIRILQTAKSMKAQFGIDYVPVALAVRNARNTYLRYIGNYIGSDDENANNNLCYDSQHLDYGIGCYVASMCLLEFVFRKLGWDTSCLKGFGSQSEVYTFNTNATLLNYTEPTNDTMEVAKACAKCACNGLERTITYTLEVSSDYGWIFTQEHKLEVGDVIRLNGDNVDYSIISIDAVNRRFVIEDVYENYTTIIGNTFSKLANKDGSKPTYNTSGDEPTDDGTITNIPFTVYTRNHYYQNDRLMARYKWKVTFNLSNGVGLTSGKGYSSDNNVYKATLSGASNVTITQGYWDRATPPRTLIQNTDYTFDSSTGEIVIGSVEGDLTITVS